RAEAGARRLQPLVERRGADGAAALVLFMRPGHGIVFAVGLERAREDPAAVAVQRAEATDVHRPQIHRRLAPVDPFGERAARPAGAGDAEGVEPGADEEPAEFR